MDTTIARSDKHTPDRWMAPAAHTLLLRTQGARDLARGMPLAVGRKQAW